MTPNDAAHVPARPVLVFALFLDTVKVAYLVNLIPLVQHLNDLGYGLGALQPFFEYPVDALLLVRGEDLH